MTAIIRAKSLVKVYTLGDSVIHALDNISFEILKGSMVSIMGPSGSGKSTLMNILGCLDQPDSGKYEIAGEDAACLDDVQLAKIRNRQIGFVFQSFNLLPRMTAIENVELPLLYGGIEDARERAERALVTVGLAERLHHEPNQLSGGQRQRIAIARAIVTEPSIILADEPTGNLDSKTGKEILELFSQLNYEGRTIIIVTHEPEVAQYCSEQIYLQDGKILSAQQKLQSLQRNIKTLTQKIPQMDRSMFE